MKTKLEFNPTILVILTTVCLASLFVALGNWQLNRADEKEQLIEHKQMMSEAETVRLPSSLEVGQGIDQDIDYWRYRPVRVRAKWMPQKQFLLDNQVHQKVAGYHVLTPAQTMPEGDIVLVNRGWVAQGRTRDDKPPLRDLDGLADTEIEIEGDVYAPYEPGFRLSDDVSVGSAGWPRVVQFLDFEALGHLAGNKFAPFMIRLSPDSANGFVREWSGIPFTPEKHLAYAWQWFGLATAVVALFFALNIKRRKTTPDNSPRV